MVITSSKKVQAIFSRSPNILSAGVRWVTKSPEWSHVGLMRGDRVLESTWGGNGVGYISYDKFLARSSACAIVEINSPEEVWEAALTQLGKPYDRTALFGIYANRDWQEDDSWYCSEYFTWAHKQAGTEWFRPDVKAIFPVHNWMTCIGKTYRVK